MKFTSRQIHELLALLGITVLMAAAGLAADRFVLVSGNRAGEVFDQRYEGERQPVIPPRQLEGDWVWSREGLQLPSGGAGNLTIRVYNDHEGQLIALFYGRKSFDTRTSVSLSQDGEHYRELARNVSLDAERVDLTALTGPRDSVWVRFSASNNQTGFSLPLQLSRVRIVNLKPPLRLPNIPLIGLLSSTVALAYFTRAMIAPRAAFVYGLAVLAGLIALSEAQAWTRVAEEPSWMEVMRSRELTAYLTTPYVVLLLLSGWHGRVWVSESPQRKIWEMFALTGIVCWGATKRLERLVEAAWTRLDPDVIGYMQLAEKMRHPYDTGSREPLWVWAIKGWFWVFGDSSITLRLFTVFLSLLLILAAYRLFRDYTGHPAIGLLVAAMLSGNPYLISLSIRGLREEAYMLVVIGLVYACFVRNGLVPDRWKGATFAVFGTCAHLLRFNSYTFVVPMILMWGWRAGRQRWKSVMLPLLCIAALLVPHLVHNARTFGDPLYSQNVHFVWLRNVEFVMLKGVGCNGCPTPEDMQVNSTPGPSIGGFEYLFGLHTLEEIVTGIWQGYVDMYLRPTDQFEIQTGTQSRFAYVFYVLGLGLLMFSSYWDMLAVILLLANAVPFAIALGIDPRLGIQTAPFATFIMAYGIWWVIEEIRRCISTVVQWMNRACGVHGLSRL